MCNTFRISLLSVRALRHYPFFNPKSTICNYFFYRRHSLWCFPFGVHTVNYGADDLGFRVAGVNLPVAPVYVAAPVV